jgi:hypothetical protein
VEHETTEGDEMETGDRLRQALIVPNQAPEARCPGEGALDLLAPRHQSEAGLGRGGLTTAD